MIFPFVKNQLASMAGLDRPINEAERHHNEVDPDCFCIRCQRARFMAQLKPLKFGYAINFTATATYTLAAFDVPRDVQLLLFRVECTMTNFTSGATDFGLLEKVPSMSSGGTREEAYWQIGPYGSSFNGTNTENITGPSVYSHLILDTDEFLIFQSGYRVMLGADLVAIGDGFSRLIQTTCYAFMVNPFVVNQIGGQIAYASVGPQ